MLRNHPSFSLLDSKIWFSLKNVKFFRGNTYILPYNMSVILLQIFYSIHVNVNFIIFYKNEDFNKLVIFMFYKTLIGINSIVCLNVLQIYSNIYTYI